jgi:formylmethanofuran dehydrogenase subunit E
MSTETIEKPSVSDGSDTDSPDIAHYVKKEKIVESAVTGKHLVALCGEVFPASKDVKGKPVCQECKRIYDTMRKD